MSDFLKRMDEEEKELDREIRRVLYGEDVVVNNIKSVKTTEQKGINKILYYKDKWGNDVQIPDKSFKVEDKRYNSSFSSPSGMMF